MRMMSRTRRSAIGRASSLSVLLRSPVRACLGVASLFQIVDLDGEGLDGLVGIGGSRSWMTRASRLDAWRMYSKTFSCDTRETMAPATRALDRVGWVVISGT